MRKILLVGLLLGSSGAMSEAFKEKLQRPDSGTELVDTEGRFMLQGKLSLSGSQSASGSARFTLSTESRPPARTSPTNGRYRLVSHLVGEQPEGSCAGTLPDLLFGNGFDN